MNLLGGNLKFFAAALAGLAATAGGQEYTSGPVDTTQAVAELVASVSEVRAGGEFDIALRLELDPHWHVYWKNPGDTGLAPEVEWMASDGVEIGDLEFAAPEKIITPPDFVSYGYEGEVFFLAKVSVPDDFPAGEALSIKADSSWLACEQMCVPGGAKLALEIRVVNGDAPSVPSVWESALSDARGRIPEAPRSARLAFEVLESTITARIEWEGFRGIDGQGLHFYAEEEGLINSAAEQNFALDGDVLIVSLEKSEYHEGEVSAFTGVLQREAGFAAMGGARSILVSSERQPDEAGTAGGVAAFGLGKALLFAFLGGLILNLMPCVFPVLSIKALGFVQQSGEEDAQPRKHGLAFAAGVLISFWVLAGALILLRAGGESLGWGFQLQSPYFVGGLLLVMFLFGLSLAGVFEIGTSAVGLAGKVKGDGLGSSFFSGVLATVVATPCTGPFMGPALGLALTLSAFEAMSVFTFLALGMATPYMALSSFPKLINLLPKPGPWMETFKQLMAFPMFATCIWLVWVMGAHVGNDGLVYVLGGLLVVAAGAWIFGRWSLPSKSPATRRFATISALVVTVVGIWLLMPWQGNGAAIADDANGGPDRYGILWNPYSPEFVEEARADGRPVFIDFTAKWCLTCKANKTVVFSSEDVRSRFQELGVVMVKADWTKRNPVITEALESFGRSGVPLYVLYDGEGEPEVLPELLNPGIVMDALSRLDSGGSQMAGL